MVSALMAYVAPLRLVPDCNIEGGCLLLVLVYEFNISRQSQVSKKPIRWPVAVFALVLVDVFDVSDEFALPNRIGRI